MMSAVYEARPIKRRRRSNAELEALDEQIVAVLTADNPQSVRHAFYVLTNPRLTVWVEKSDAGYDLVQRRILALRRAGVIPYGWITDATRRGYHVDTFGGTSEFLRRVKGLYRADLWSGSGVMVEVWAESRSIAGVVEADCSELAVSLYPSGGFTSATLAHQAAENINMLAAGRDVQIFYIGDYDQSGVLIDRSIERELRTHVDPRIEMDFKRIAINEAQILEYDLPTKPRKETDRRSPQVAATVEAEAMPAHILRHILRYRIEALLPPNALHVARVAEESEREYLEIMARHLDQRG